MATVQTIDFDAVFDEITAKIKAEQGQRLAPPQIRIWDGDWNLRGECHREISASFAFVDNETGDGTLEMPADYYLSAWLADVDNRLTTNVFVTVDKDGARWSGMMDELQVVADDQGRRTVRVLLKHDYEHLKHILAWSNPFLPAEVQFPRLWVLSGHARWALKTTLFCNLHRLEGSLWMLPDNPLNPADWGDLDQSAWSQVVKPDLTPDTSVGAIVTSRFKTMHEVSRKIVADAQLSWEARRYLSGDEPPWPGADLRHGTLVWDLVDKSGWNTGTSFGGSLLTGLVRAVTAIADNGIDQQLNTLPDPNIPAAYSVPGNLQASPSMPGVIYIEGEHTGVQASTYSFKPATDVGVVSGGHSMPGTNEGIRAAIQAAGDLTAMIPGVPPLGGVADSIISPLFMDVFLAFGKWKSTSRAQRLGWSHYHERFQEGADRAYTLAWLLAQRAGMWDSREKHAVTLTVADGAPWRIGQNGKGHFFLGDRVGFSLRAPMVAGRIIVERVTELTLAWDRDSMPTWEITVGQRDQEDPALKAIEALQDFLGILQDLGVT